ncbi:MAG: acyl-CoA thioesterase [Bacteroidetes bacterium]|nr:acyl-CoA thioesterase [Bacteroidota bacterium]
MYVSETTIRVRYAETDRMGYVYYGNYAQYYEVGRVEALRQLGMSYRVLEDSGIILPVMDYSVKFLKPAFYDDLLTVKTTVPEIPKVRIKFLYEVYNEKGDKLNEGETTLVFINQKNNKPCAAPVEFMNNIAKYF